MSKEGNFESLLNQEFRWPKKSDQPFTQSKDWERNANIEEHGHGRLVLMMTGYKAGADLMVERSRRSGSDRDTLVFPIIFSYRQFIELSLKYVITTYGQTVGVAARWTTHDLVALWKTFLNVLEEYGIDDPNKTDPAVATIVVEFAKVDPNSYSYRYPVDVRGNPIPITGLHGSGPFGMMTVNDKWMAVAISTANPFGIRNVGIKIVEIFMHVLNEVRIMNRPDNRGEQDCDRGDKSQC